MTRVTQTNHKNNRDEVNASTSKCLIRGEPPRVTATNEIHGEETRPTLQLT
jgi:hypothetical protein